MRYRARNCTGGENVPGQNGDTFCHFAVCFALEENRAAKTFFEITVQYL
jgi:hypothetical protein